MGPGERIARVTPEGTEPRPTSIRHGFSSIRIRSDRFDARCARPSPHSGGPALGLFSAIRHILDSLGPTLQLAEQIPCRTGLEMSPFLAHGYFAVCMISPAMINSLGILGSVTYVARACRPLYCAAPLRTA